MAGIRDHKTIMRWLEHKPASWAQILACRSALRIWPLVKLDHPARLLTFRALSISFAARNIPARDLRAAASAAVAAIVANAANNATFANYSASAAADAAAYAAAADAAAAATTAAYSAANSVDAAAADTIWPSAEADTLWLENAKSSQNAAEAMTAMPLWLGEQPDWVSAVWQDANRNLRAGDVAQMPLLDWFDRRIAGQATAFALPRAADVALQIRIAEQDGEFWERDFATVNADIQGWIEAASPSEPEIPSQHPNELQTVIRDDRIAMAPTPPAPIEAGQNQRRQAAWRAIRDAIDDYRADGPTNSRGLDRVIARVSTALGTRFDHLNAVGLGVQSGYLQAHAERADDILMPERAADLVALNMAVSNFLPHFAEWAAYLADADARPKVTAEALKAAIEIVVAIEQSDAAEPEVKAALDEMRRDALEEANARDPDVPLRADYRQRFIGALRNALATAGKIVLDSTKAQIKKGLETVGKNAVRSFFVVASAYLISLSAAPEFAWLAPLLLFLKNNAPKD